MKKDKPLQALCVPNVNKHIKNSNAIIISTKKTKKDYLAKKQCYVAGVTHRWRGGGEGLNSPHAYTGVITKSPLYSLLGSVHIYAVAFMYNGGHDKVLDPSCNRFQRRLSSAMTVRLHYSCIKCDEPADTGPEQSLRGECEYGLTLY